MADARDIKTVFCWKFLNPGMWSPELSTCREVDISNSDNGDLLYWYVVCY